MNYFNCYRRAVAVLGVVLLGASLTSVAGTSGIWPTWGGGLDNNHHVVNENRIRPENVQDLQLKWIYDLGSITDVSAKPTMIDGTLYFPDFAGYLHAVDAKTGASVWKKSFAADYSGPGYFPLSRNSPAISGNLLIMGSQTNFAPFYDGARVIAVRRQTGDLVWSTKIDDHPASIVTQSPVVFGNRVYVGIASIEEALPNFIPGYPCCTFRGSVVMLDATTGQLLAKTYTTPGGDVPVFQRDPGQYSGNAVWGGQPAVDASRGHVYVTTGNNYEVPEEVKACEQDKLAGNLPADLDCDLENGVSNNHYNSIMALDLATLEIVWARRLGGFDAWNGACGIPGLPLPPESEDECPDPAGPDYDFGEGPMIVRGARGGQPVELVVAGQKSGYYWALSPDTGEVVWSTYTGAGGLAGGMIFGSATDGKVIYAPNANLSATTFALTNPAPGSAPVASAGFWTAMDALTGEILWQHADPIPLSFNNSPATLANGIVYVASAGSVFGGASAAFRALDAATGRILWSFDLGPNPNGMPVLANSAPTIMNGVVYWGAGYGRGSYPDSGGSTNLFYAFELPQHGKEYKEESDPGSAGSGPVDIGQNKGSRKRR